MPAHSTRTAARTAWLWRECTVVAKATGRYFPREAQNFERLMASVRSTPPHARSVSFFFLPQQLDTGVYPSPPTVHAPHPAAVRLC
jgi:hypothetical protein